MISPPSNGTMPLRFTFCTQFIFFIVAFVLNFLFSPYDLDISICFHLFISTLFTIRINESFFHIFRAEITRDYRMKYSSVMNCNKLRYVFSVSPSRNQFINIFHRIRFYRCQFWDFFSHFQKWQEQYIENKTHL